MTPGYVYILTNEAMPGLIKIGRTTRDVDLRASELWQTGVPQRFDVFCACRTLDCVQLEAYAHASLSQHRVSRSREFFRADPELAYDTIRGWQEIQAQEFGHEFFNEHFASQFLGDRFGLNMSVCPYRESVSGLDIQRLANETGQKVRVIADALERLTAAEIEPAIARALEDQRREAIESFKRAGIPRCEWEGLIDE